jgi:hypothetical protein
MNLNKYDINRNSGYTKNIMDVEVLNKSLQLIEEIYDESLIGGPDVGMIKPLINSLDINHWEGKQWLVDIFSMLYNRDNGSFYVGGGWMGLLPYLIRKEWNNKDLVITSGDIDPICEEIGNRLFNNQNINFITEDIIAHDISQYSAIISTSSEHITKDNLEKFVRSKSPDTWVVLQSNNYFEPKSHINCYNSVEEFADWIQPLLTDKLYYIGILPLKDWGFDRFMVIGK